MLFHLRSPTPNAPRRRPSAEDRRYCPTRATPAESARTSPSAIAHDRSSLKHVRSVNSPPFTPSLRTPTSIPIDIQPRQIKNTSQLTLGAIPTITAFAHRNSRFATSHICKASLTFSFITRALRFVRKGRAPKLTLRNSENDTAIIN